MIHVDKRLKSIYRLLLSFDLNPETALNFILVDMGFKDAMTCGYSAQLIRLLRKEKYRFIVDQSYLEHRIDGFFERVSSVYVPGAEVVRRLYVTRLLNDSLLKNLQRGSDFTQGHFFGFPVCCLLSFCRKAVKEGKEFVGVFLDFVAGIPEKNGVKRIDYHLSGELLRYLDSFRLIHHIPCRHDCPESLALARRNLQILSQLDAPLARSLTTRFLRPFFYYGNSWEESGIVQIGRMRSAGRKSYDILCSGSLPLEAKGERLTVRMEPHRSMEISAGGKQLAACSSPRPVPWSYCLFQPYDSLRTPGSRQRPSARTHSA